MKNYALRPIRWYQRSRFIVLAIVLFWPLGIVLCWKYTKWSNRAKVTLTTVCTLFTALLVVAVIYAPPFISVDHIAADNRISTDDSKYTLTGDATFGSIVTVDGIVAARDGDKFSATVALKEGDNDVTIRAVDGKKESDQRITIHRATTAELQAGKNTAAAAVKRAEDNKRAADAQKTKDLADAQVKAASSAPAPQKEQPQAQTEPSKPTVGKPFRVTTANGTAADVTIVGVTYPKTTPSGAPPLSDEYVVLDVQVTGRSSQPFHYSEQNFAIRYADSGSDPYQKYSNTHDYNVSPSDWTAFSPNLGEGNLTAGQTARGTVPFDMSSNSQVVVAITDDSLTNTLAEWLFTTD